MALGVDTVVVRTPFESFIVRVRRVGAPLEQAHLELARRAAREFRAGLDAGDPGVVAAARQLVQLLDGNGFAFGDVIGERSGFGFGARANAFGQARALDTAFGGIAARLEQELLAGRFTVEQRKVESLSEPRTIDLPDLPPLPPAAPEPGDHSFEVRFVDEVGQAISGVDAEFTAEGAQTRGTNAAGIALLDSVQPASADVEILDVEALSKVLDPRWTKPRPGAAPRDANTLEVLFRGGRLGPFSLKAEVPNTVVIKPPLGKLFVELWDKTGRVRHANRDYQISGPQSFAGTTDERGRILHEDVFPGDYQVSLGLDFFEESDPDRSMDIVDGTLVVLAPEATEPQVRRLGVVPRSVLAQLHAFFNTNKTFLLPTALPSVRKLRKLYFDNAPCELLVVGHADTRGGKDFNDKLSLERAQSMVAYLEDDVDTWLDFYSKDVDAKKRWGKTEDHLMTISMPDFVEKPKGEDPVRWYQRTRGLEVDGTAGKETRRSLVGEYMSLDGASLADFAGAISATAHGCGENFSLDDSGEEIDAAAQDEKRDPKDRRVELFFFDPEFGITPAPTDTNSAPGSPEYPLWRKRVSELVELRPGDTTGPQVIFVELADAHFRTDSAVVLPEGEDPDAAGAHQALSSVGVIATALRFNDEHSGRTLLVAGHTDTTAGDALNDELSRQRAGVGLALLEGDRDSFGKLCDQRHKPADINQILSWVSQAFSDLKFDCNPGTIGNVVSDAVVRKFQTAFNNQKSALGSTAANLVVDGSVGELTWGAFFDCYELALQRELGETPANVAALRSKLKFADTQRKALGFGEHFPIEELGVDNFRSQTNRRVEYHFFEPGEEPDLVHAEADPETSELYLPGNYERTPLTPLATAGPLVATWAGPPPAQFGQQRSMTVAAPGMPAGEAATFTVEQVTDGVPQQSAVVQGSSSAGGIQALFSAFFNEELVVHLGQMQPAEQFPVVSFRFTVECGGRRVVSNDLLYADSLLMQVLRDPQGPPAGNAPFLLRTAWGTRPGSTDAQGNISVTGLPPGGAQIDIDDRLIASSVANLVGGNPVPTPPQQQLDIALLDEQFQPRDDIYYTIIVDDFNFIEGRTLPDGRISESIDQAAQTVVLQFDEDEVDVTVASLQSTSNIIGVQQRLNNLGYDTGPLATALNSQIESALVAFRRDRGLAPPAAGASALDATTRTELQTAYGS